MKNLTKLMAEDLQAFELLRKVAWLKSSHEPWNTVEKYWNETRCVTNVKVLDQTQALWRNGQYWDVSSDTPR